jgi:S-methylmethionine-dependent homocysteine/selenocysteine methylase
MTQRAVQGVLPTSTGSEVERRFGFAATNFSHLFGSDEGRHAIASVAQASREAGATIGVTPTYRLTPHRAYQSDWSHGDDRLVMPDNYSEWNRTAVSIIKEVYQGAVILGSISPTTFSSANPDEDRNFAALGARLGEASLEYRIAFARRRQAPQISLLAELGVDGILFEACRFRADALAAVQAAREFKIQQIIISFEADEKGFPDPFPDVSTKADYSFADMRADLEREAGGHTRVQLGVNCTGASNARRIMLQGQQLDVVYPNRSDFFRGLSNEATEALLKCCRDVQSSAHLRSTITEILEQRIDPDPVRAIYRACGEIQADQQFVSQIRRLLHQVVASTPEELVSLWQQSLQQGASVIGICCGGTPEDVTLARSTYDDFHTLKAPRS